MGARAGRCSSAAARAGLSVSGSADAWALQECAGSGGCSTALHASHDGGKTWAVVAHDVVAPSFISDQVGWAVSRSPARPGPLATRDGGKTWTELPLPCTGESSNPNGLHFADAQRGWLLCAGQPGAGSQAKAVYATADGGKSWTPAVEVSFSAGSVNGLSRGGYASGLFFLADGHGWLWESRGGLFASAGGGKNWLGLPTAQPESIEVSSAWFLNPTLGYLLRRNIGQGRTKLLLTRAGDQSGTVLHSWQRPG